MNLFFSLLFLSLIIPLNSFGSPVGKGLSCYRASDKLSKNFEGFRGIYFESNKTVRVVSFKNKNNSLKVISKQTPYKISKDQINFKIKFIWYGDISFEYFMLNRNNLDLTHNFKNYEHNLECEIITNEFMSEMNSIKTEFQNTFDDKLKSNNI